MHWTSVNEVAFKTLSFSEMKAKLPADSWWVTSHKDDNSEIKVAFYDGDLVLKSLDLDLSDAEDAAIIFVNGNLNVTGSILNENTDGAVSLMVHGDLCAKNMAVGGQEIYVAGNMKIDELLCGSYNHGQTVVKGSLDARVVIEDDYRFLIGKGKNVDLVYDGIDEFVEYQGVFIDIHDVLTDAAFIEPTKESSNNESSFYFGSLVSLLKAGKTPLENYWEVIKRKCRELNAYFPDCAISKENMTKLTTSILMPQNSFVYDFREDRVYYKIKKSHLDDDGQTQHPSVFIDSGRIMYFAYFTPDGLDLLSKNKLCENAVWEYPDEDSSELRQFAKHWVDLLINVSIAQCYLPRIEPSYIEDLLKHPKIKAFDPEDEDNDGFWDGNRYYRFWQEADGMPAEIVIELQDGSTFFYQVADGCVMRYCKISDAEMTARIGYSDLKKWEQSEKYFKRFREFVEQEFCA